MTRWQQKHNIRDFPSWPLLYPLTAKMRKNEKTKFGFILHACQLSFEQIYCWNLCLSIVVWGKRPISSMTRAPITLFLLQLSILCCLKVSVAEVDCLFCTQSRPSQTLASQVRSRSLTSTPMSSNATMTTTTDSMGQKQELFCRKMVKDNECRPGQKAGETWTSCRLIDGKRSDVTSIFVSRIKWRRGVPTSVNQWWHDESRGWHGVAVSMFDRHTDWQTDWQTHWLTDWLLTGWLTDWLTNWLTDRQIDMIVSECVISL
jgi:hypothetical protein